MSSFDHKLNTKSILKRVGVVLGSDKNKDIADGLGVDSQVCTNWKTRNTIPWVQLFNFSTEKCVSMDWLLTGKEKDKFDPATLGLDRDDEDFVRNAMRFTHSLLEKYERREAYVDILSSKIKAAGFPQQNERRKFFIEIQDVLSDI